LSPPTAPGSRRTNFNELWQINLKVLNGRAERPCDRPPNGSLSRLAVEVETERCEGYFQYVAIGYATRELNFTMTIIDDFIERYVKEYDFYYQAGRLAAQKLEEALRTAGIRSMVTDRAKSIGSLQEKCRRRDNERGGYQSVEEIYEDIVDLAGVRVALYFPGERRQVDGIISRMFHLVESRKEFPDPARFREGNRFSGYSATHYRVQLREQSLDDAQKRYAAARVEIQVASVLMHAWSEVEHDLVYKPLAGELSGQEYAILDQLNGLVMAGEISLETLQRAGEDRVDVAGRTVLNHYELAAYLLSQASGMFNVPISESGLGRVDLLFDLISELAIDTPQLLAPYIEALHGNVESRPVAEQLIDALLAEDPSRYRIYRSIRARRSAKIYGPDSDGNEIERQVGNFMTRWIELEGTLRMLSDTLMMPTRRQLEDMPILDRDLVSDIDLLRRMRNNLVHGIEFPPAGELAAAAERISEIVTEINHRQGGGH
jgi:ppGpp synthetase/RelA/SpoT-type nucleotidyltranferase